jgi:hypothetical protein
MTDLTIDDATLNAAERLLGVRYTDAERAQMRDNLAAQIELAVRRRAVKLPNALPPATLFDPRLRSFRMPAQSALNIPRSAHILPQADEDIAFAPVRHHQPNAVAAEPSATSFGYGTHIVNSAASMEMQTIFEAYNGWLWA